MEADRALIARRPLIGRCPDFFRVACREAQSGGESGYRRAAKLLGDRLLELPGDARGDEEWRSELANLELLRTLEDVLRWCDQNLPACLKLVPRRRRREFARGIAASAVMGLSLDGEEA